MTEEKYQRFKEFYSKVFLKEGRKSEYAGFEVNSERGDYLLNSQYAGAISDAIQEKTKFGVSGKIKISGSDISKFL